VTDKELEVLVGRAVQAGKRLLASAWESMDGRSVPVSEDAVEAFYEGMRTNAPDDDEQVAGQRALAVLAEIASGGVAASDSDVQAEARRIVEGRDGLRGRMTRERLDDIVGRVEYEEKRFRTGVYGHGWFVQVEYTEPDVRTGEPALQRGRKWLVSRHATDSEVVQTCFAAVLASAEHQAREHFKYAPSRSERPRAIFGPHFSSDVLYGICGKRDNYDARDDPE
jgi:hypothetical protein